MRHEWTDGKRALALENGSLYERGLTVEEAGQEEWLFIDVTRAQSAVFREILRLAARVREMEAQQQQEEVPDPVLDPAGFLAAAKTLARDDGEAISRLGEENRRLRAELARRDRLDNPLAKPFDR